MPARRWLTTALAAGLGLGLAGCGTPARRALTAADPSKDVPSPTVAIPDLHCTEADVSSPGPAAMPTPTRLGVVESFPTATVTLSPPAPDDQPVVPAQLAWDNALVEKRSDAHYEVVLARMSAQFPATAGPGTSVSPLYQGVLVWAVIARRLPIMASYGPPPLPGQPPRAAQCFWADGLDPTEAVTGQRLFSDTFGSGR